MEQDEKFVLEIVFPTPIKLVYAHYLGFKLKDSTESQIQQLWNVRLLVEKLYEGIINRSSENEKIKRKLYALAGMKYKVKRWWQFWR